MTITMTAGGAPLSRAPLADRGPSRVDPMPAATAGAVAAAGEPWPRLSVVVPTCGRHRLLFRCLRALQNQTLPGSDFEVVVVDDGHDEETRIAVEALAASMAQPRLRYLRPPGAARQGPARARNHGWRIAAGRVIAFTDDDTVPLPEWLAEGEAALAAGGHAGIAGRVRVPLPAVDRGERPPTDHELTTRGLERTEFVTANAFVRRDALERVGGFDERFTRAWREDSDLQFRLEDQPGGVARCERAVVLHPVREEPWGVSLRQQRNAAFEALLYAKHPRRYRRRAAPGVPWRYYAIVVLTLLAPAAALAGAPAVSGASTGAAAALVLGFAWDRLRETVHTPRHVGEMLATSALIPFLSVYWRLRGALRWRVWFL